MRGFARATPWFPLGSGGLVFGQNEGLFFVLGLVTDLAMGRTFGFFGCAAFFPFDFIKGIDRSQLGVIAPRFVFHQSQAHLHIAEADDLAGFDGGLGGDYMWVRIVYPPKDVDMRSFKKGLKAK